MNNLSARFAGVELYFDDLERAKKFYVEILGLKISSEKAGHHVQFNSGAGFVCLETKGAETYPSSDKAVLFFEVPDLKAAVAAIGQERLLNCEDQWAVLRDPDGHSILLLETHRK